MTLTARFDDQLNDLLDGDRPDSLAVAVSGGGDSTALLFLAAQWAKRAKCKLFAATVDHGLRKDALQEAANVAKQCAKLGIPHETLTWKDWNGAGNLQDQARGARYRLIGHWADEHEISRVLLGHTHDDQAETVLMRLARGSGVDGLSAIAPIRVSNGIRWMRPLLNIRRDELRKYLQENDVVWTEDPSNDDPRFDRVKVRAALKVLETLGVTQQGLADTATRMMSARQVLAQSAYQAACDIAQIAAGTVTLDVAGYLALPSETRRRLLAHTLCWVAGEKYPPRNASLMALETAMSAGKAFTLHGCLIQSQQYNYSIGREPAAVSDIETEPSEIWDKRWKVIGTPTADVTIRYTGEDGLKDCPDWRATGHSRFTLMAAPAIWKGDVLVAAPLAGYANGWCTEFIHNENHFYTSILSH